MNRKSLVLPFAVALLAPALAACGGSDGSGGGGRAIVVGTLDRVQASTDAPAPLDPAAAYDSASWNVLRQTVQSLLTLPSDGGEPVPEAAEHCGFTDSGNERFSCKLRSGLKFADGTPITVRDVKYSVDRVRGLNVENGPASLLSTIDTVETQGNEVIFHLNTPDATFPYKLATPTAGIVEPSRYPRNKLRKGFEVDGSGPYTVRTEVGDKGMTKAVFTRNGNYKGTLEPKNDKAELRAYDDPDVMAKALDKGQIDLMSSVSSKQIKKFSDNGTPGVNLVEMSGLGVEYLVLNTKAPAIREKAVRQAIAQVVDRGELVSKVRSATAEPLYSLVPGTLTGHENSFFNKYSNPSAAAARRILDGAHIDTPVKITLTFPKDRGGTAGEKEFEVLRDQLNRSGLFRAQTEGVPSDSYFVGMTKGQYQINSLAWFPDFPDADNYLAPFLDKGNVTGTPYVNKTIRQQLIPASRREADRGSAAGSLKRIQDIAAEDVPLLPLWQGKQFVAAHDDIVGVERTLNSSSVIQLWELRRGVSG